MAGGPKTEAEAPQRSDEPSRDSSISEPEPAPAGRVKARSEAVRGWAHERRSDTALIDVPLRVIDRDLQVAGYVLAGGLAVRLFLWLLPVCLIAAAAFGFLERETSEGPAEVASDLGMSAAAAASVVDAAQQAGRAPWYLLLMGLALLAWASYTGAKTMQLVHSEAWGISPERLKGPALRRSAALFTGVALLLLMMAGGGGVLHQISEGGGLALGILLVAAWFGIWLGYTLLLPRPPGTGWRDLAPGALLMAVGAEALYLFTVLYVTRKLENSAALYGALGFAATFLFWLLLISRLTVYAALLNSVMWNRRR